MPTNTEYWQILIDNTVAINAAASASSAAQAAQSATQAANNAAQAANTAAANADDAVQYVAPAEASSTAAEAHAVGDYFIYDGKLYQTTTAIEAGGTITPGTNCTQIVDGFAGEVTSFKANLVLVQSTQPTAEENRIWIPTEQGEEVEVPTYEEFEDVKSAFKAHADTVDALSLFVNYNDIASFTLTPAAIEIGNATASVTLAWTFYATPASLTLNGVSKSVSSSGETVTATDDGSTHQVTYTLATSIGSKTEAFHFYPNLYWGVSSTAGSPTSAFVIGLASKQLSGSKAKTFTVNAGSGQYIYFCSPVRYGQCAFKSGGFEGGFEAAQTVSVTNASGYTENYYVYRSTNPGLGSTTITVS